jgi:hypothetical protein
MIGARMPVEVPAATLTVFVGVPTVVAALPSEGQLLLVEADPDRAQRLKHELGDRQLVAVCVEVLAAQSGTFVRWFSFNDPRLNGPLDAQAWRERYPNLRLIGEEQRTARRLEEVLNAWAEQQERPDSLVLSLHLRQGDPLAALEGLGAWIAALQRVHLVMPAAAREISEPLVHDWLVQRGFEALAEEFAPTWRRDPLATQRLQLQDQVRTIADLEEQLATQAVHLLLAQTQQDELRSQRDVFLAERDNLHVQLHAKQAQFDQLICEKTEITKERDHWHAEAQRDATRIQAIDSELNDILALLDSNDTTTAGSESSVSQTKV